MESLDLFHHSWLEELLRQRSQPPNSVNNISQSPSGDLCQLGRKSKQSIEYEKPVPPVSNSIPSIQSNNYKISFTIGIREFVSSTKVPENEPPQKKLKASNLTIIDELIRDIDETTDVPFFNVSLPREIALHIFDYLSINDIYSCLQVCKSWYSLLSDDLLWQNVYKQLNSDEIISTNVDNWKNRVKEAVLSDRQLIQNFKNHQCRTTKLTYRLGNVLTCANNDKATIVAGYSTGIIRTWSIKDILNADVNTEEDEQLNTPDIIYESADVNPNTELSIVESVGLLRNDIYAVHEDGLVEIWTKDLGNKPRFTQKLSSLPIKSVKSDDHFLCISSRSKFSVWNFHQNTPQFQSIDPLNDLNDCITSFCMSSYHSVPISIIATDKSLWCLSLSNITNRYVFYSLLQSSYSRNMSLDIHNEEPLAVAGVYDEIKLFDLESGRCNIIPTNYNKCPGGIKLVRANKCPMNEFVVAFNNHQISIYDHRQKEGAIQHFYNHFSHVTTLQMDSWKLASTDECGFVRLWDRRMSPNHLWHMNPQSHPVTYCSFDKRTLIFALTPSWRKPDDIAYQMNPDALSGHIYVCDFKSDISTKLDEDLKICTSSYDAPQASNRRVILNTPYDIIE